VTAEATTSLGPRNGGVGTSEAGTTTGCASHLVEAEKKKRKPKHPHVWQKSPNGRTSRPIPEKKSRNRKKREN